MKLGVYTAVLHDKPLEEALAVIRDLGLVSAEINSGGFLPAVHLPIEAIRSSQDARDEYLGKFAAAGVELTALNCNGNPLHPDPEVRAKHGRDVLDAIELGALLGVERVVTMSGLPGTDPAATLPAWSVLAWESSTLLAMDYQWNDVAIPYWKDVQARAAAADVKVALEMHPHNLVYNPATMERLATEIGATHVGAEMDPSHLFWQGIDPVLAVRSLGDLIYNAAAKDTRINEAAKINGVLDNRHRLVDDPADPRYLNLGGKYTLSAWPENPSWDFVAVGRGHDIEYWAEFLRALGEIDPDMPVNIEHEDQELDQLAGLRVAAETLLAAQAKV
jgi:sugar phosphate isomerase/epimerase